MQVARIASVAELAKLEPVWSELAGDGPFLRWEWLEPWWRHYVVRRADTRGDCELLTLVVRDQADKVLGIAPWFLTSSATQGRVLRFLGSGEVCSDYLTVLCRPEHEAAVADALAEWLTDRGAGGMAWDALLLDGVRADDIVIARLASELHRRGCGWQQRPGLNCWRLQLPETWAAYEALLSKSHRKQVRRLLKRAAVGGRAQVRRVQHVDELPRAAAILERLHQRRQQAKGELGCFSSESFKAFHRESMLRLLGSGRLWLQWLELDGRPVAVDYAIAAGDTVYCYQGGLDPDAIDEEPGRLCSLALMQRALEEGYRAVDFLRGDEPYKAHFRAQPIACTEHRLVANHAAARWRHRVWQAGQELRQWVKRARPTRGESPAAAPPLAPPIAVDVPVSLTTHA